MPGTAGFQGQAVFSRLCHGMRLPPEWYFYSLIEKRNARFAEP
jgi:hypothetical protein